MKLSKIALAASGLCAAFAGPVLALPASDYTNASEFAGDTLNIRTSGATAVDPGFFAAALRLCATGGANSIHRYSIQNNAVLFCNINPAQLAAPAGRTKLAFYKHSQGGSGSGVQNVNLATPIAFLDLSKITANCAGATVTASQDLDGTNPLPSFIDTLCTGAFNNTANTSLAASYIGVSDVEPQFFGGPSAYNNLRAESLASVIFAVPVTRNIFEVLQAQQGLTIGSLDEANMPSLSQAQITSLFTQQQQTWSAITGQATGLADDEVYVARRVSTSGTQKTFEALVARTTNSTPGGRQCQSEVDQFVSGPNAADNAASNALCIAGNYVVNNSGSNQVITCMNKHQTDGRAAVGVLSTEYKQVANGSLRFVKANGVAPTYRGVASGQYTYYGDIALNTRLGANLPTATALGYANYLTALKNGFANPATIEVVNGSNQTFGPSGLVALDVIASPVPPADYTGATARNPWSRLVGGTDLNNCQPGKAAAF
ncbi:MAG: hypothetical protein H7Z19_18405 [Chitinophagaceae bacterium]|nr:hypothetical protein [Rubrivivax sp.]